MSDAGTELHAAVRLALGADSTLVDLVGGADRIHDAPPRNAATPHVVVETLETRDIGGLEAPLAEHRLTLKVWSRSGGKAEALAIADRIDSVLDDSAPTLPSHRLVSLRLDRRDAQLARDRLTAVATLVFRAVTEPA